MRNPLRAFAFPAAFALTAALLLAAPLQAQRRYRLEATASGAFETFDQATELQNAFGGNLRLGYWLFRAFSIEAEGSLLQPKARNGNAVTVTSFGGAGLLNIGVGQYSTAYLKAGYATVSYGGSCPPVSVVGSGPCGSDNELRAGVGMRVALSPTIMLRAEGGLSRSSSSSFSNYGLTAGLSWMIGSQRLVDSDGDGVYDRSDHCAATPAGALVDSHGCPTDSDSDGVYDGVDRCPQSPAGATVDRVGCPRDTDHDGVLDGVDRCQDTPVGANVDAQGCPVDSDNDGVFDGLDRCPDTPAGARVDGLGCPNDTDGDGVPDGIDQCPATPVGTAVNAAGCAPNLDSDHDGVPDDRDRCPGTTAGLQVDAKGCPVEAEPPAPAGTAAAPAQAAPTEVPARGWVIPGNAFALGKADLRDVVGPTLDSIALALASHPRVRVEIVGNAMDRLPPQANRDLSTSRAQAIRLYLLRKGVHDSQLTIRGNGAGNLVTRDTTAAARVLNRRTEIRVVPTSP